MTTTNATKGSRPGPGLIKAYNARALLDRLRQTGTTSRADLSRETGISKPTVSAILAGLEQEGIVRQIGYRTGVPGPVAALYEIRAEARHILGIDVGRHYLRAAVIDLHGHDVARESFPSHARNEQDRVEEILTVVSDILAAAQITARQVSQTVIGGPGVYSPERNEATLTGALTGWADAATVTQLRSVLGDDLVIENDVNLAALAEKKNGNGRDVENFAFVSVGTGVGMGLVLRGRLHHGAHGIAGELGYLPLDSADHGVDPHTDHPGGFESAASAAGVVRAARRAGLEHARTARDVFDAAKTGDARARAVVEQEASLIARAICTVALVADPDAVILGGGIGQADGFAALVQSRLDDLSPVHTPVLASALGTQSVLEGCLAHGFARCWDALVAD